MNMNVSFFEQKFDSPVVSSANASAQFDESIFVHDYPDKTVASVAMMKMENGVEMFHKSICSLNANECQTNNVYENVQKLIQDSSDFYVASIQQNLLCENSFESIAHVVEQVSDIMCNGISERATTYRRHKQIDENSSFVRPRDLAIGLRWERVKKKRGKKIAVRLIQNTFYYVPLVETLQKIFMQTEFEKYYFDHNSVSNHICDESNFVDFCCGSVCKQNDFCENNPNCIRIQIYADEFEVCNPLQSKAGEHKMIGVYFTIRNMPREFSSELNNIFLLCLVNSNDLKSKQTDYNNVWHPIVKDLHHLETTGIRTSYGNLKGTLTDLSLDNLEANTSLGFASSFSATHYCRICLLSNSDCQHTIVDNEETHRTIEDYDERIGIVEDSGRVIFSETKGVKRYCDLNDLDNFHVISNPTCDVMHDLNEGAIPHLLKVFFEHNFAFKHFDIDQLRLMVQFHNYGWLNRKNIPSQIKLDARSIGQNAAQSMCLFRNLPFVLYKFKENENLKLEWECVQLLLKILVVVYSYEIREANLKMLETDITSYLKAMIDCSGKALIPKLHFLLHHPSIIRMVGPVDYMSTMRYEAKHKVFKKMAQKNNNFKNILNSLAFKHQRNLSEMGISCSQTIYFNQKPLSQNIMKKHYELLLSVGSVPTDFMETASLRCNNYEYRKGFLIIHDSILHQIQHILCVGSSFFFISKTYEVIGFDGFLNSFQISEQKDCEFSLIHFTHLKNRASYEIVCLRENEYIIEENLEFRYQMGI